jgi:hypothetical protein
MRLKMENFCPKGSFFKKKFDFKKSKTTKWKNLFKKNLKDA